MFKRCFSAVLLLSAVCPLSSALAQTPGSDGLVCLIDVSKDFCNMKAIGGGVTLEQCVSADGTRVCYIAKCWPRFWGNVKPNLDFGCAHPFTGIDSPCDCWILPDKTQIKFFPRLALRLPVLGAALPGCVYRGVYTKVDGRSTYWAFRDQANGTIIADGDGHGTLGSGSHRFVQNCDLPGCERCYEVQIIRDPTNDQLYALVHVEGILKGRTRKTADDPNKPCRIVLSLRGEMRIPLNPDTLEPLAPSRTYPWWMDANVDGEVRCTCDSPLRSCLDAVGD